MGEGPQSSSSNSWMGMSLRTLTLAMLTAQYSVLVLVISHFYLAGIESVKADLIPWQLLHYSRVMPLVDGHRYLPSTAVFLHEVLKLAICLTIALYEISTTVPRSMPATSLFGALSSAVFGGDSWKMAIPASLYTVANNLQYIGISNLEPATFQVTYQFKIIVTAIFSVVILKQRLTLKKWIALLLLMVGVIIVSVPHHAGPFSAGAHAVHLPRALNVLRKRMDGPAQSNLTKRSATYEGIEEDELAMGNPGLNASVGLLAVIGLCISSGLGGVYFEKVIKDSPKHTSLWIRNVQLAVYSIFPALFIGVVFLDGETVAKDGFFAGYDSVVVATICLQTFGGIVAAFTIYYADNISKNFATSISLVISSLVSFFFFDFEATGNFLLGTSIVLFATYLYGGPDARPRPPPIRLGGFEKLSESRNHLVPNEVSIKLPTTPIIAEEGYSSSSRPGSPNGRRPGASKGYFSKIVD